MSKKDTERKSPVEVIATHRYRPQDHTTIAYRAHCVCGWTQNLAGTNKSEVALHSAHVLDALRQESYTVVDMLSDSNVTWVDSATFDEMMSDEAPEPSPALLAAVAKVRARREVSR